VAFLDGAERSRCRVFSAFHAEKHGQKYTCRSELPAGRTGNLACAGSGAELPGVVLCVAPAAGQGWWRLGAGPLSRLRWGSPAVGLACGASRASRLLPLPPFSFFLFVCLCVCVVCGGGSTART
jgi:hypothetical protein